MKKITLSEATEQQIIDAIRRNPDGWELKLDTYEQVSIAMEDNNWKEMFEEQVTHWGDHDSVDWDEDGNIEYYSDKTDEAFRNYLECSMESLDCFVDIDDLEIDVEKRGDMYQIIFWTEKGSFGRHKYDEVWCHSYSKVEVED
jgi:hypothetical protein